MYVYKKGQSCIYLLRQLRSFGVRQVLLKTFYDSIVSFVILYSITCWGGGLLEKEKNKLNKLIKKAGFVMGSVLPTVEEIMQDKMIGKLSLMINHVRHPINEISQAYEYPQLKINSSTLLQRAS